MLGTLLRKTTKKDTLLLRYFIIVQNLYDVGIPKESIIHTKDKKRERERMNVNIPEK